MDITGNLGVKGLWPDSLTHRKKVVPIFILQFENEPLFPGINIDFQLKMTLFYGKTLTFLLKMNPHFSINTHLHPRISILKRKKQNK